MTDSRRPRVLYVAHRVPFPPDKGDRIRNYHLLRQLAARFRVAVACPADEPVPAAATAELARLCPDVAIVPTNRVRQLARAGCSLALGGSLSEGVFRVPELARTIAGWHRAEPFAAAVVSASSLVPYLRQPALRAVPGFVDVVDVDSQKWFDFAAAAGFLKRHLYRLEGRRVRRIERALPDWAETAAVVSRAEADLFDRVAGHGTATVATNGVDLDYFRPTDTPEQPAVAFVGALDYLPNVDAAVWFAGEVWPQVRERVPTAEFRLIGRKPTAAVQKLAAVPGVVVVGSVPDVRPYVASAAVCVAPMRLARGLQNKVLEALAMGKATVAAPPALAALAAEPGRHLLSATTPADWADAVAGLLLDPARRAALGAAGREFVDEHHHWDRCLRPLTDAVAAACDRSHRSAAPPAVVGGGVP